MVGGSKITLFFTSFKLLKYISPQPDTNDSISTGFDEGPPYEKHNVLWLVSCPSALWLANSLDGVTAPPLPKKQQVFQYCHINSDHQNIELEDHAEPLHAWILQDILNVQDQCARHIKLHPKLSETVGFYQKYCDIKHPHWVSILKCAELKVFSPPRQPVEFQ